MTFTSNMKKINKRIPGLLPPPLKSEVDGKITKLSEKTVAELLELRDRQLKLLNNKAFISKLADKGEKIKTLYEKIENELKVKQEEEQACQLFDRLSINNVDKKSIQNVEWEGKLKSQDNKYLDSDDDSEPEDAIHILSQCTALEKKVKILKPDKPLLTPDDVLVIGDIPHVKYIVEKTEQQPKHKATGLFKPYKTTKSDVHNPEKEMLRKKHKHWEVTAATPPPTVHGSAKMISLEESLNLQKDYNIHLKEVEARHAAEKLLARTSLKMAELPQDTAKFGTYRDASEDSDATDLEGSDKEVHDEEPELGGIVYTIMN